MIRVKKKYLDISNIYNVEEITTDYVRVNIGGENRYVYLFKLEPIIVVNSENIISNNISYKYEEFLRNINVPFQIIVSNKEIEFSEFFEVSVNQENEIKKRLVNEYMENLKELFKDKKIYITQYYLIISSNSLVENVENYIKVFEEGDMVVKKVDSKSEIKEIIMKGVDIY